MSRRTPYTVLPSRAGRAECGGRRECVRRGPLGVPWKQYRVSALSARPHCLSSPFTQGALEVPVYAKSSAGVQPEEWSRARVGIDEGLHHRA